MSEEIGWITWSGGCIDGKASGEGRLVVRFSDGEEANYEGSMRAGKMHGQGTYIYPSGNRFEGGWRDSEPHGHMTYFYTDGSRGMGEWRHGKMHGYMIFTWADGTLMICEYRDGKSVDDCTFR